jgi:hypothetical protein
MKKICSITSAMFLVSSMLAACGGGGGNSSTTELHGTWVASTDSNPTGDTCGLTPSGQPGERFTATFDGNRYTHKSESCLIITGNKGSYIAAHSVSGTYYVGDITLESSNPAMRLRALDLMSSTTIYTSYNISSNTLHIALPDQTHNGVTRDKRASRITSYYDPASDSIIANPAYNKQG